MNIVKIQNDLKDLSDQQLYQTMQGGAAPQYLVLGEMQRRKKMRQEAASQPQQPSSVAEDIMAPPQAQGIAAMPQAPMMRMASGGIIGFANTGYVKGEQQACYKNPLTGRMDCPPAKPDVRRPKTSAPKKADTDSGLANFIKTLQQAEGGKEKTTAFEEGGIVGYADRGLVRKLLESGNRQFDEEGNLITGPEVTVAGKKEKALGKNQILPSTAMQPGYEKYGATDIFSLADEMGVEYGEKNEENAKLLLANEMINDEFADRYQNAMANRFGEDQAFNAYHAGPGNVARGNIGPATEEYNAKAQELMSPNMPIAAADPADIADYRRAEEDAANVAKALRRENAELTPEEADTQRRLENAANIQRALYGEEAATDAASGGLSALSRATTLAQQERTAGGDLSQFNRANKMADELARASKMADAERIAGGDLSRAASLNADDPIIMQAYKEYLALRAQQSAAGDEFGGTEGSTVPTMSYPEFKRDYLDKQMMVARVQDPENPYSSPEGFYGTQPNMPPPVHPEGENLPNRIGRMFRTVTGNPTEEDIAKNEEVRRGVEAQQEQIQREKELELARRQERAPGLTGAQETAKRIGAKPIGAKEAEKPAEKTTTGTGATDVKLTPPATTGGGATGTTTSGGGISSLSGKGTQGYTGSDSDYIRDLRRRMQTIDERDPFNRALLAAGLGMMTSKRTDLLGAIGEGGLAGLASMTAAERANQEELRKLLDLEQNVRSGANVAAAKGSLEMAKLRADAYAEATKMFKEKGLDKAIIKSRLKKDPAYSTKTDTELDKLADREFNRMVETEVAKRMAYYMSGSLGSYPESTTTTSTGSFSNPTRN